MWTSLKQLYGFMAKERRRQFYFVLALMIAGAFAELATIGAVLPFLTLLAGPEHLAAFPILDRFFQAVHAASPIERLTAVSGLFMAVAILAGLIRLQLAWSSQSFVFKLGHELSVGIQRRVLLQPYEFHLRWNSSNLFSALEKVQVLVFELLLPLMQALTGLFISTFVVAGLLYIDPFTAVVATAAFAAIYLGITATTRKRLRRNSEILGPTYDERVKIIQESLGGIRDVIIDGSQALYLEAFRNIDLRLNDARTNTVFIGAAPRFVIESLGMVLIAMVAVVISNREGGLVGALPILGALALGAQRLLPLLQQVYNGWTIAAGNRSTIVDVLDLLRLPVADSPVTVVEPLPFRDRISLKQLGYSYANRRARTIDRVSFEIPHGSITALIGTTGSGKSTLADLIMGLLDPDEGEITIDGNRLDGETRQRWWRSIAHVPQSIFLADTSIARNIAFSDPGEPIDMDRAVAAASAAQLHEFVETLPDGYETVIGERGIRLSGGQRQRLGLARAIYKTVPVLILDEATSALDDQTEAAVMRSLESLVRNEGRTILMIAHRLSTVARCDRVVRLEKGRVTSIGSYSEVVDNIPISRKRPLASEIS
jgi:ATP-binding cassette subfamily B protein